MSQSNALPYHSRTSMTKKKVLQARHLIAKKCGVFQTSVVLIKEKTLKHPLSMPEQHLRPAACAIKKFTIVNYASVWSVTYYRN